MMSVLQKHLILSQTTELLLLIKVWSHSKNQVNIPDYARNKIRKSLIQIRKDYLEKVNLMNGENKEPINETLKKKNELIRMLRNSVLNEDVLIKIGKPVISLNLEISE